MKNISPCLILLMMVFSAINGNKVLAQRDTAKLNKDVEVIKPYRPTISNANKMNQLPVIEDTTRFRPEFNYSIENRPITSGFRSGQISAQEINTQTEKNPGIGYAKLGAGFYNTTYGELFLNNNNSKNGTFGLRLKHLSSQGTTKLTKGDRVDSPYSQNSGEIYGGGVIGSTTLSGNFTYDRDVFRYYGYPDTIPRNLVANPLSPYFGTKQQFQKAKIQFGVKSNEGLDSRLKYKTGLWYQFFDTKTGQKENAIGLSGSFNYDFTSFYGLLETSYEHFNTKGIVAEGIAANASKQSGWFKLAPSLLLSRSNWTLNGGLSIQSVSDNTNESKIKVYPKIGFTFVPVTDQLTLYAGLNGYLQNCNYSAIAYENYWVEPIRNVRNADHQYIFTGGVKGKITKEISYNLGAKYEGIDDMHFYILKSLSTSAPYIYNNAFDIAYDNVDILTISAELSYVKEKDYSFLLKGNYFSYTLFSLPFAPHLPDFELVASGNYRINERLTGFSDLKITGQRNAIIQRGASENVTVDLDPICLLNIGTEYDIKPKYKIFGRVDNLLNQKYEQLVGYTSQGLRLIAGVAISF